MKKTSGFRTIEFIEVNCDYNNKGYPVQEYCVSGSLFTITFHEYLLPTNPTNKNSICTKCNGTGIVEVVESKI